jgi:hypothetical protein
MVDRRDQILQRSAMADANAGLEGAATDYGLRYRLFR